ncbi:MAG: hypothetical protein ACQESG_01755 [Nanobdellota archaeon]
MKKKEDFIGLFVPAGLFIGMGIGLLIDKFIGATLLGLGLGFLALAVSKKKK